MLSELFVCSINSSFTVKAYSKVKLFKKEKRLLYMYAVDLIMVPFFLWKIWKSRINSTYFSHNSGLE